MEKGSETLATEDICAVIGFFTLLYLIFPKSSGNTSNVANLLTDSPTDISKYMERAASAGRHH